MSPHPSDNAVYGYYRVEIEQDHGNTACSVGHITAHTLNSDVVLGKEG